MTGPLPAATSLPCTYHSEHRPRSHVNQVHHVHPLGEGGPDVAENKVVICPTGHVNVHRLLDEYRRAGRTPAWDVLRRYTAAERQLAELGWIRMRKAAA